jgi:hypothetical protein
VGVNMSISHYDRCSVMGCKIVMECRCLIGVVY